ncbi:MerR family transcriptional regulator [Marivita sp. S2033]|uniref:MerR family transcriptional regulator n=1 Tax=Marivita sp. S2033 TaxID=3373187 RepID=UPI003981DBC8
MSKSADAFRTISEVADWLETPAHVLRFWESKFTQVKPVKRAGGRRYYRPADMRLLGGIKKLLHEDGMTIKGVQKILREQGIKHVSSLCASSMGEDDDYDEIDLIEADAGEPVDTVVPFAKPKVEERPDLLTEPQAEDATPGVEVAQPAAAAASEHGQAAPDLVADAPPEPAVDEPPLAAASDEAEIASDVPAVDSQASEMAPLPDFLQHSMDDRIEEKDGADQPEPTSEPAPPTPDAIPEVEISSPETGPGALAYLARITRLSPEAARQIAPVAARLRELAG